VDQAGTNFEPNGRVASAAGPHQASPIIVGARQFGVRTSFRIFTHKAVVLEAELAQNSRQPTVTGPVTAGPYSSLGEHERPFGH
jgi:hypothetical protein